MKLLCVHNPKAAAAARVRRCQGLTLVEMTVTMGIFALVVIGFVYANLFGMRYDELICSKLGASEQSRMSFDKLTGDIRASKMWHIGNGDQTSFTPLPNATNQLGNAVQLNLTTDTNSYIRYYFETNNARLCRMTSAGEYKVIAQNLTNSMYFHAEDYTNRLVTDLQYKYVIVTTMEFCQYQFPKTYVGPGYYYDYYKIQFKVASHCPN